jgi:hypothetical protein
MISFGADNKVKIELLSSSELPIFIRFLQWEVKRHKFDKWVCSALYANCSHPMCMFWLSSMNRHETDIEETEALIDELDTRLYGTI